MNKFEDFNASYITPQKTLIGKLNYIIKFLKENPTYNVYVSADFYDVEENSYYINNLSLRNHELKSGDGILFANSNFGLVDAVGEDYYTVYQAINFQGDKGDTGDTGEQGVSITNVEVVNDEIICTLSDGTTINAGAITGFLSVKGTINTSKTIKQCLLDYGSQFMFRYQGTPGYLINIISIASDRYIVGIINFVNGKFGYADINPNTTTLQDIFNNDTYWDYYASETYVKENSFKKVTQNLSSMTLKNIATNYGSYFLYAYSTYNVIVGLAIPANNRCIFSIMSLDSLQVYHGDINNPDEFTLGDAMSNTYKLKYATEENIKTINNQSLIGTGDIQISGGSGTKLYLHQIKVNSLSSVKIKLISTDNTPITSTNLLRQTFDSCYFVSGVILGIGSGASNVYIIGFRTYTNSYLIYVGGNTNSNSNASWEVSSCDADTVTEL